jgi:DNA-binding LacI/PurR family transcriptional regulator
MNLQRAFTGYTRFDFHAYSLGNVQSSMRLRGRNMANMKDIARIAGVSLGTVSHVLNNTANVRAPLRKRVLDAVQAVGYQPSQLARGLRRDKTNVIGMVIPDITNPFFPGVVRGAEDIAFSNGYRLVLCNTDNDHAKELVHLKELRTYLPAGLIVIPSNFSDLTTQVESYRRAGTGVVCVDRLPRNWVGDSVTANNEEGALNATRHLIDMDHKRLAMIVGPLHLTNARDRLNGFRRALRQARIPIAAEYIQETSFDKHGGYSKTHLLLRLIPRPTAIFAGNDMIALGALRAIREAGLRCPEDVSVMGFDNLDLAELTHPALSSVSQSGYQLGTTAAHILIERLHGDRSPAKHIVLPTSLILRNSVTSPAQETQATSARAVRRRVSMVGHP